MVVIKEGWDSRKYKTAWLLTTLTTIALIGPHLASYIVGPMTPYESIITGSQWLTFLFGIWGIYFGANVAEKSYLFRNVKSSNNKYSKYDNPEEDELNGY
jgi:hypothetical protein